MSDTTESDGDPGAGTAADAAGGRSDGPSAPARKRSSLTGRAAMLAVAVCMLAISLAYPLREYLAQRGDINDYRAQVAEQQQRVGELEKARERWNDPAYVEAQARERLRYVMPGEIVYVVLEADRAPAPDGVVTKTPEKAERSPWFSDLWHSVEAAGKD